MTGCYGGFNQEGAFSAAQVCVPIVSLTSSPQSRAACTPIQVLSSCRQTCDVLCPVGWPSTQGAAHEEHLSPSRGCQWCRFLAQHRRPRRVESSDSLLSAYSIRSPECLWHPDGETNHAGYTQWWPTCKEHISASSGLLSKSAIKCRLPMTRPCC